MKYTPKPPVVPLPPQLLIGTTTQPLFHYFGVCPSSQTLISFSLTHQRLLLYVLPCKTWSCPVCSRVKIKKLALEVQRAEPNRLLTLTVNPALYASRLEAWQETRKKVPLLIRFLRTRFGEVEYLRVTEVTRDGWPHYHLLVRSGYLPHEVVKREWKRLTGAWIVDLRQVKKTFSAYKYLVKYLSKLHDLEWTERHVSLSRGFVPKAKNEHPLQIQTAEEDFFREHPAYVMLERYPGSTLVRLSDHAHLVLRPGELAPVAAAELETNLQLQAELSQPPKNPPSPTSSPIPPGAQP